MPVVVVIIIIIIITVIIIFIIIMVTPTDRHEEREKHMIQRHPFLSTSEMHHKNHHQHKIQAFAIWGSFFFHSSIFIIQILLCLNLT